MIVGQILYYVPIHPRHGNPLELRVTNVGRKWATLEYTKSAFNSPFGRCNKATGWVDGKGYASPGRCWTSQAAYEDHRDAAEAWGQLRNDMNARGYSNVPDGLTATDIQAARVLLKL